MNRDLFRCIKGNYIYKSISPLEPGRPLVALTFDDGPTRRYTPQILDILDAHNSVGTFFVLGSLAVNQGDILARMSEGGHQIGIHSYDHVSLIDLSDAELYHELISTQEIIEEFTGEPAQIMRPTYGFVDSSLLSRAPLPIILWSVDTLDWESQNSNLIYNSILDTVKDGDIVLMHDIFESTVEAIRLAVPALINKGFQLVTVSELAQYRGVSLEPGKIYSRFPPPETP